MMKIIRFLFLILTLCCVFSCKISDMISSSLSKSQNICLKENQTDLKEIFMAYQFARKNHSINHVMDSIITSLSDGKEHDTVFVMESCNPPLYSYYAIVWNKDDIYTLFDSESFCKGACGENDLMLMKIIEKWDKKNIISKSHEMPLSYYGEWPVSRIASRIVIRRAKCESVESVFFYEIDTRRNANPVLYD